MGARLKTALVLACLYAGWGLVTWRFADAASSRFVLTAQNVNQAAASNAGGSVVLHVRAFGSFPTSLEEATRFMREGTPELEERNFVPVSMVTRWRGLWNPETAGDLILGLLLPVRFDRRLFLPDHVPVLKYHRPASSVEDLAPDFVLLETPPECGQEAGFIVRAGELAEGGWITVESKSALTARRPR